MWVTAVVHTLDWAASVVALPGAFAWSEHCWGRTLQIPGETFAAAMAHAVLRPVHVFAAARQASCSVVCSPLIKNC
jgi:hypothetical protein